MKLRRPRSDGNEFRHALHEFGRALALIVDEAQLDQVIVARLQEVFGFAAVTLFSRDGEGVPFRAAAWRGVGDDVARAASFVAEGRLPRWLRINETMLVLDESPEVVRFLDDAERATLRRLAAVACIPLVAVNRLTGMLVVGERDAAGGEADGTGARRPGALALDAAERELLAALAVQIALAVENAALLRERKARLKRLYRAERLATAGELAAGAAHEIRNPLAGIRSAIQYLRADYPARSERADLIDNVLAEVDRIDGIVQGMLSFARQGAIRFQPVDAGDIIGQAVTLVAHRAREQGVKLRLDAAGTVRLAADPALLKQVVLNLLLNALQAMPAGGELRLSAAAHDDRVELLIADTGVGIPPVHLERIFDPFFTTRTDGTGLGLSVVYGIVERHGGEIEVESESGRGTTVTIRLPTRQRR